MQSQQKLTLMWLLLILAGVLLALFFGIGWLFLALTIRRALMILPPLRSWVRERCLDLPPEAPVEKGTPQYLVRTLGYVTIAGWVFVTMFAFIYLNIPVIEIFRGAGR
jgi:hypothetical protein